MWCSGGRLPSKPADTLDSRDRHVARKVSVVDRRSNVDGRKERLKPLHESAELDTRKEELVGLGSYANNITTSVVGEFVVSAA